MDKLIEGDDIENTIAVFLSLSDKQCQYYFEYIRQYEELLYQLLVRGPENFLNACDTINDNKKRNISLGLCGAYLVEDDVVLQAYNLLKPIENRSKV